jgi:apolipoprotein N-acyltransferase
MRGGLLLHPFAWAPALLVFSRLQGARALAAGWLTGTVANLATLSWILGTVERYAGLGSTAAAAAWLLCGVAHGLVWGVFACGVAPVRRAAGAAWPAAVAAWFTACEHWSPQLFPYAAGVAWAPFPRIFLAAALTGVAGMTFLLLWLNASVALALETLAAGAKPRVLRANAAALAASLVIALGAAAWQEARVEAAEGRSAPARLALVQHDLDAVTAQALAARDPSAPARRLVAISERAVGDDPEIRAVLWPEGALRRAPDAPENRAALEFARRSGVEVWTGATTQSPGADGTIRHHNSAFRIRATGELAPVYHKQHLVPFSERTPAWLPTLREWSGAAGGFGRLTAGTAPGLHDAPFARAAFLICYEAILADAVREVVGEGADLLVNLSYEGWFGDTAEPHQHLLMARAQAAQVGVPMVRASTTGITAFIDARGRVTAQAPLFERTLLVDEVRPLRAAWLYARWGSWFAWLCSAAVLALLAVDRARTASGSRSSG